MGDFTQMVAGGGVVGMQAGSQVPTNYRDFAVGQSIIKLRGENLSMYTLEQVEEIGRTGDSPFAWPTKFFGDDHMAWKAYAPYTSELASGEPPELVERDFTPYDKIKSSWPLSERFAGTEIPFGPQDKVARELIEEQSISGRRRSDIDEMRNDPDLFPAHFAQLESQGVTDDWDALSGPYRAAQLAKENAIYASLYAGRTAEAGAEGIRDIAQGVVAPYTDDPATQRQAAAEQREGFVQKYITGPAATLSQSAQDWAQDFDMVESGVDAYNAAKNYLGDDLGLREWAQEFDMFEAGKNLHRSTNDLLGEYLPDSMTDQAIVEGARGGLGRVRDWWNAGYNRDGSDQGSWRDTFGKVVMDLQHPDAAPESVRDAALETEADEAEADEAEAGGAQFMPARQTPDLRQFPVTDVQNTNAMGEDHKRRIEELSVSAEEDEATAMSEIESLITKTQDDARKDAFDAWMMNVGAGVASGDMAGGLEKGAIAISDIKKDARDAIRSLDATRLSRYFEGSKEELERAIALANVDANFATILVNAAIERGRGQRAYVSLIGDLLRHYESNMMYSEGYDDPSSIPTLVQRQASQMFDQNLPASVFNVNAGRITSGN